MEKVDGILAGWAYPPQLSSYALPSSLVYPVDPGTFRSD
jgi:hypothetical protein